jgi:hypothetical protein
MWATINEYKILLDVKDTNNNPINIILWDKHERRYPSEHWLFFKILLKKKVIHFPII